MNSAAIAMIIGATVLTLAGAHMFLKTEPQVRSEFARKVLLTFFTTSYMALLVGLGAVLVNYS